jgi:transcriptional regulator GlxA family with amidase domain
MPRAPRRTDPVTIGLVWYPGAQAAAIHGLADLFTTAARLHRERGGAVALSTIQLGADGAPATPAAPLTALVVPPSIAGGAVPARPQLATWVAARHREGTVVCSVCVGAFVLAEAGLLDGRPATTHWALAERFAARFPEVALDADQLVIDDGDLITAGGVMAWIDLGLRLVERYLGPAVMIATARYFLVDPGNREQRFYSSFVPPLAHRDDAILRAQHWLHARSREKLTVPMMARKAGLGERTFLRRFQRATGQSPTGYLQCLRVSRARDLLETTVAGIDEIAGRVGYGDPSAFRKLFHRTVGLTPGEYRRRFAVSHPSRR